MAWWKFDRLCDEWEGVTGEAYGECSFCLFFEEWRADVLRKDMATRIIAAWYLTGQEKGYPAVNFDTRTIDSGPLNLHVDVQGDHYRCVPPLAAHLVDTNQRVTQGYS